MTSKVLRPCWIGGTVWLFTALICPFLPTVLRMVIVGLCAVLSAAFLIVPVWRRIHIVPFVGITVLLATVAFQFAFDTQVGRVQPFIGKAHEFHVLVEEADTGLLLKTNDGIRFRYYPKDKNLELSSGDTAVAAFVLKPYRSDTPFASAVSRANGLWLIAEEADEDALRRSLQHGQEKNSLLECARQAVGDAVQRALQGDAGAVVTGICLGKIDSLSSAAVSDFRSCGVSHLFSVSGLHMAVLVRGIVWLLRRLRVKRVWRALMTAVFLLGFMALVGFSPSVVRSGLVCMVAAIGDCLRRQADTKNSLGLALLILLVPQPFAAFDVGLLLSFSATYGLVCWTPTIRRCLTGSFTPKHGQRIWEFVMTSVSVSLAALLSTLPITAVFFGRVSLLSIPANLLTVLPSEGVLIVGFAAAGFSLLGLSFVAQPLFLVVGGLAKYLLWVCEKFSTFSFSTVAIRVEFLVLWLVGVYSLFLLCRRFLSHKGQCALLGVCFAILCIGTLLHQYTNADRLRVQAVTDTKMAAVVTYRGQTVAVVSPQKANVPYRLRTVLDDNGLSDIDVLCIVGGEEPFVSALSSTLDEYVTDRTRVLYADLPWRSPWDGICLDDYRASLGESLVIEAQGDVVWLTWDTYRLAVSALPLEAMPDTADVLITVGERPLYVRTADGAGALSEDVLAVVADKKQWYVEGVEDNAGFGARTQATSEVR